MRDFKGMKRQRGRNRKPGNAQTVYERYQQLARDAASAGDRVLAENYLQHAEHYFRVLRALQPQRSFQEIAQREQIGQGFDIDFEDESGAQAAAFVAAQQAAERQAQQGGGDQPRAEGQDEGGRGERQDRNDEGREGARRETRRERWERRREERKLQQDRDGPEEGAGAEDDAREDEPAQEAAPRPARRPRQSRTADENAGPAGSDDQDGAALPGFLTRAPIPSPAPQAEAEDVATEEKPAPRRRAPRRKAADTPVGEDV